MSDDSDALEYDAHARTLVVTPRIDAYNWGRPDIVARDVPAWFGVWAVAVWDAATINVRVAAASKAALHRAMDRPPSLIDERDGGKNDR